MAQVIKIKRSAVASKIPATADLALGELAMNTNDGKLFMKKNNGTDAIVEIGATQTASNVGASGVGVFNQKTGNNFEFKKLVAGTNMTVTDNGTTVTLDAASGGGGSNPVGSTAPGFYQFQVTLSGGTTINDGGVAATIGISNFPSGWTFSSTSGVLTVTHNLGRVPVGGSLLVSSTAAGGVFKVRTLSDSTAATTFQLPSTGSLAPDTNKFIMTINAGNTGGVANGTIFVRVMF